MTAIIVSSADPFKFPWYLHWHMVGEVPAQKQLGVKAFLWVANSAKFRKATKEFPEVLLGNTSTCPGVRREPSH